MGVVLDIICKLHQVEQIILCVSSVLSSLRLCIFDLSGIPWFECCLVCSRYSGAANLLLVVNRRILVRLLAHSVMCALLFLAFPCGYRIPFSGTVPVNAVITLCNFRH